MKNIIKDSIILFIITAVAGLLLAVVNELTKGPIEDAKLKAKAEACRAVFSDAVDFEETQDNFFAGINMVDWQTEYPKASVDNVYIAKNENGEKLGYVINLSTKEGYGGQISICMGIRNDMTINAVTVLSSAETVGLGLEAETVLSPQFTGKNSEKFSYTKTGSTRSDEIDAISSATITTNAFVNLVNAGIDCFKLILAKGGN